MASMTDLRPECGQVDRFSHKGKIIYNELEALSLILKSVLRRRTLIRGKLDDEDGKHCATGCFWADHPRWALPTKVIADVAAQNDSLSDRAKPKTRWKMMKRWLQERVDALTPAIKDCE